MDWVAPGKHILEVATQVGTPALRVIDHRGKTLALVFKRDDLAVHPLKRVTDDGGPLGRICGGSKAHAVSLARLVVFEQLANLREREACVVAKPCDEAEALQVVVVVQTVGTIGTRRRGKQPNLLVVADGAGRDPGQLCNLLNAEQPGGGGGWCNRRRGHAGSLVQPCRVREGWTVAPSRLDFHAMPTYRAPRGTRDLLPADRAVFDRLIRIAADLTSRYGFRPIETPLFEQAALFERGIGEVTDVVEKELFRIAPRTEEAESWALRPEPTAGIMRAYVQHGMQTWPQPVKLTTTGPMFRYDRPQAGRYRQFWQFDVEAVGDAGPAIDAEVIELGHRFYAEAGVRGVEVLINSIGDPACRPAYVETLKTYYRASAATLPPTERDRLERNVLRLLDSKDPDMAGLNAAAPRITDHLCEACAAHFEGVKAHLDAVGVPYRIEPGLVRGLDYYTRTAFEYYVAGREGQQQALGGGGRYDGLVELLGGRSTPGIGFGLGLDRVALVLAEQGVVAESETAPLAVVVGADPDDTVGRLRVATMLRAGGLRARADLARRKLGRQLEAAGKDGAHFAVILGDELAEGQVQLRDLQAGTQRLVGVDDLVRELARAEGAHQHG